MAFNGSARRTTWPTRSCATAACPYGEQLLRRRNGRTSLRRRRAGNANVLSLVLVAPCWRAMRCVPGSRSGSARPAG
jgi:hypothetical protein